jgi:hypothetical protein
MTRRLRLVPAVLATLSLLLALAPAARANDFQTIFRDYRDDGAITPCKYSDGDLKNAQGQIPNDIEQYAPDFPAALDDALQASARGDCAKKKPKPQAAPATSAPPAQTPPAASPPGAAPAAGQPAASAPPPTPPAVPQVTPAEQAAAQQVAHAAARRTSDASTPAPLIFLAILAGLALLAGALVGVGRLRGWDFARLAPARHALAEAGYRTGGLWSEFVDWVRLGH